MAQEREVKVSKPPTPDPEGSSQAPDGGFERFSEQTL